MDASDTGYGNGIDSRGINLEILIRGTHSGNSLIIINLHWFAETTPRRIRRRQTGLPALFFIDARAQVFRHVLQVVLVQVQFLGDLLVRQVQPHEV
jgi:hypothetical protein